MDKVIEFKEFETLAKLPSLEECESKDCWLYYRASPETYEYLNAPATETYVIENYSKRNNNILERNIMSDLAKIVDELSKLSEIRGC